MNKQEFESVKNIGERIGYGNLMEIASALWRDSLEKQGLPTSGAFVPTLQLWLEGEALENAKASAEIYDQWHKKFYK